ncbi:MAG: hypothetical protein ACLGQW_11565 [Acidobacteriota bacterium]
MEPYVDGLTNSFINAQDQTGDHFGDNFNGGTLVVSGPDERQLGGQTAGPDNQRQTPNRELGPLKWRANPFPDYLRKAHGKGGAILGAGIGARFGQAGGVPGALAGAAIGGLVGAYGDDALDYIGVPSDIEIDIPSSYPAECDGNTCDRMD